jgi:hypothetical protein
MGAMGRSSRMQFGFWVLIVRFSLVGLLVWALSGCSRVTIEELGWVSQPNMQFEEYQAHGLSNGLLPQVEPGNNASGGGQAAGCIACK